MSIANREIVSHVFILIYAIFILIFITIFKWLVVNLRFMVKYVWEFSPFFLYLNLTTILFLFVSKYIVQVFTLTLRIIFKLNDLKRKKNSPLFLYSQSFNAIPYGIIINFFFCWSENPMGTFPEDKYTRVSIWEGFFLVILLLIAMRLNISFCCFFMASIFFYPFDSSVDSLICQILLFFFAFFASYIFLLV